MAHLPFPWILLVALAVGCSSGAGDAQSPGDAGGEAGAPPQELDLDEGTFTVQPGEEVVYCVRIPMPEAFRGRDLALTGWSSDVSAPMHHYFMFYDTTPTKGSQPVPCQGSSPLVPVASAGLNLFSMGTLVFVAGTGQDAYRSNPGYGAVLQHDGTFVTNHHVINATAQPVTASARFKLTVVDATKVAHPTRALSCQTIDISLAAHATTDVTATCLAPFDLDIVTMSSHAHQDLTTFETRMYDGKQTQPMLLYSSSQWESPVVQQLVAPLHLKAGQGLTFTCHYTNATAAAIGFGLGSTQEMCASMNDYAYPVAKLNQVPPMLGVTVTSNPTPATAGNTAGSPIPLF